MTPTGPQIPQGGRTPHSRYDRTPEPSETLSGPNSRDLALQALDELRNGVSTAWVPAVVAIAVALTEQRPVAPQNPVPHTDLPKGSENG